ncbi:MAG: hypothetical protein GX085_06975 [Firmicutes bacterium]|nr:hypothetical protein [Bacillota bacterium]
MNFSFPTGIPRLLRGQLVKGEEGRLFLKTARGFFPVKLEGEPIPLGQEFTFKFLRHEPGRVVMTRLSPWEYWQEALPFLKELPGNEEEWQKLLQAALRQNLPLEKDILLSLRRWVLTAEKKWGVSVDPQVFAFLLKRNLPVTPGSILATLYLLFPRVQKEIWLNAHAFPGKTPGGEDEETGKRLISFFTSALAKAGGKGEDGAGLRRLWTGLLRMATKFLAVQAGKDEGLPQMVVCFSPGPEKTVRWEGRGTAEGDEREKGYSFRLTWNSQVLGRVEVAGVAREEEAELLVAVEKAWAEAQPEAWRALQELKPYLEDRGWRIKQVLFSRITEGEEKAEPMPPRVDGWV